ncbi:hypothetical protein FACS1894111_06950 [Clostridia bacterium]|nr:hypothetical protein FACS1894111_06950 [Clostridia bacterium]
MVLGGTSFSSLAAATAGATDIGSIPTEANSPAVHSSLTAGISFDVSQYLAENTTTEDGILEVVKKDAPVVQSPYANLGVSQVEDNANIRQDPNTDSEVVGKLYSNSEVEVLDTQGDWYHIRSGNVEGYIATQYVTVGDENLLKSIAKRNATINTDGVNIRTDASTDASIVTQVSTGAVLPVEEEQDGWVKVAAPNGEGYVSADFVSVETSYKTAESKAEEEARLAKEAAEKKAKEEAAAKEAEKKAKEAAAKKEKATAKSSTKAAKASKGSSSSASADSGRSYSAPSGGNGSAVASYASQFVGNPYVYGGTSLTNGTDCSGFIMSVYAAFGVSLPHSSEALRSVGYAVDPSDMQAGDIVCYSGHVALATGGGGIVHASTPSTGIKYGNAGYKSIITVRRIF